MGRSSICVALFLSVSMSDLHPKGIDLGMKPSAPSCPPILPLYPGLQTEQTESQGTLHRKSCLGLGRNSYRNSNYSSLSRGSGNPCLKMTSDYCGFNRNSVEIKETQETKTKGKIQDEKGDEMEEEMEDRRQR